MPGHGDHGLRMQRRMSRREALSLGVAGGVGALGGGLLAGCAAPSGGPTPAGSKSLTWSSWANPGEAERFRQFSADYNGRYGIEPLFQVVVGDYTQKLLTRIVGDTAPDAFYVNEIVMGQLIKANLLADFERFADQSGSEIELDKFYPGLMQWCRGPDGGGLYGVPVDCNPKVFWFNQSLLTEAGVTENPAQLQEAGRWDQNALTELLTKIKTTGKRGMVFEANWFDLLGWISTFGGATLDERGEAIFHEDPKAIAVLEWLWDQLAEGNVSYGGTLPRGQGVDALFYGGQLATIQYGRWILPNLRKLEGFTYDIAPLPSESGSEISTTAVYCAAMCVNSKTNNPVEANQFAARFCNAEGQRFRLSGGGNAVPAIPGLDEIVTEGGVPEHGHWFSEIAARGFTTPQVLVTYPERSVNLSTNLDSLMRNKTDFRTFAQKAAGYMNGTATL
ncbi:ABC transporter substrate-binding protein [Microlunatus speluncae]|uniref:ABC transporter substrate-binding protein n=1 Tax=Microlunatus speluncae TaxID=2594267 RepID=UPI0013754D84|nr:extracellular solute-binding protein [Microlunatus speluncae]